MAAEAEAASKREQRTTLRLEKIGEVQTTVPRVVAVSPDGRLFAVPDNHEGFIAILDATASPPCKIACLEQRHVAEVKSMIFSGDGKWIVSSGVRCNRILVHDVSTSLCVAELKQAIYVGRLPVWSPDGRILATADSIEIVLWDVLTWKWLRQPIRLDWNLFGEIKQSAFSNDGTKVLVVCSDGTLGVFWLATGCSAIHTRYATYFHSASWTPDGERILVSDHNHAIRILDSLSGVELAEPLTGHRHTISQILFTSDPRFFMSVSLEQLRLWRLQDNGATLVQEEHLDGSDLQPQLALGGCTLYTSACARRKLNFDVSSTKLEVRKVQTFTLDASYVESCRAGLAAWRAVHVGMNDHDYDCAAGSEEDIISSHFESVCTQLPFFRRKKDSSASRGTMDLIHAAFDVDPARRPSVGDVLAATVRAGNQAQEEPTRTMASLCQSGPVACSASHASYSGIVAFGDDKGAVTILNASTEPPVLLAILSSGHGTRRIKSLSFSHSMRWLVSVAHHDKFAVVSDVNRKSLLIMLEHARPACSASFSADGDATLTVCLDGADDAVWCTSTWTRLS